MQSLKNVVDRLARQAGVNPPPIEQWREREWLPVVTALEAGAAEVRVGGMRFTCSWYAEFKRAWDSFRALEAAVALEQLAGFAEKLGDACGLSAALREQANGWRQRAAELEAQPAGG
jgi:hypothetical protein